MVNYCVCAGCTNTCINGVRMHPFPHKNAPTFRAWVHFVQAKRKDFTLKSVSGNSMVCGAHFKKEDYDPSDLMAMKMGFKSRNVRLNKGAVPSIHAASLSADGAAQNRRTTSSITKRRLALVEKLPHKRKSPTPRNRDSAEPLMKKREKSTQNTSPSAFTLCSHEPEDETADLQSNSVPTKAMNAATAHLDFSSVSGSALQVMLDQHSIKKTVDNSCQTDTPGEVIKLKLRNKILHNTHSKYKLKHRLSIEDFKHDDKELRFYTGLTWLQFMTLWNFLGPSLDKLPFHKSSLKSETSPRKRSRLQRKLDPDPINELFLTLIILRTGLVHNDLAYRFGISVSLVSKIVTTWIQFLYLQFSTLKKPMFVTREVIGRNLPLCFRKFKGVRTIIDCTEFYVQQASNFEQQDNLFSSYKSHGTYKVLIGVSPTGAVMFVSDAYEGSMSDVEIVKQSGFLDHLEPGDLILADRCFTIREVLAEKGVDLNIPPFVNGRKKLTQEEEIYTKQIARVRIHVERCIERLKKFRLLGEKIPLSMQSIFSEMVFVAGCLVNFQEPLVTMKQLEW